MIGWFRLGCCRGILNAGECGEVSSQCSGVVPFLLLYLSAKSVDWNVHMMYNKVTNCKGDEEAFRKLLRFWGLVYIFDITSQEYKW